jgi:hypothetical protein
MVLRQFPRKRMLATAAADDKNPHDEAISLIF